MSVHFASSFLVQQNQTETRKETMTEILNNDTEITRRLLVGIWMPVDGNPKETMEYRADSAVRMKMFGGLLHMDGSYRFIENDIIEINWGVLPSPEAEQVIEAVNEQLAQTPEAPQVRVVQRSVLAISVTETELHTFHLEKGRVGHFRRAS
jgi:hypothetical protein